MKSRLIHLEGSIETLCILSRLRGSIEHAPKVRQHVEALRGTLLMQQGLAQFLERMIY